MGTDLAVDLVALVRDAFETALEAEVGPDDDFFGQGGDSLNAIVVVSELEAALGVALSQTAVFSYPTPAGLAAAIRSGEVVEGPMDGLPAAAAAPADVDTAPLTPPQRVQLTLAPEAASRGFISWVFQLNGALDEDALAGAYDDVVERYEVLRAEIVDAGGEQRMRARPFEPGVLRVVDLREQPKGEAIEAATAAAQAEFESLDPLARAGLRATLYRVGNKSNVLTTFVAEALVDADSAGMLAAELARAYCARTGQEPDPDLPVVSPDSFLRAAAERVVSPAVVERATEHWLALSKEAGPDRGWPLPDRGEVATYRLLLDPDTEWPAVPAAAQALRTTQYVVVLAAFQAALARLYGATRLAVTSVVADRGEPGTERMIGSFHTVVRVPVEIVPGEPFADVTARTAQGVRDAVAHYAVPALLVDPVPHAVGVHFYMLDGREGPSFPGIRRRRFRLHSRTREALRLNTVFGTRNERVLAFSSTTLDAAQLERLAHEVRETLLSATADTGRPVGTPDGD